MFREAYAAHRNGRLDEAERLYLAALGAAPDHVDALHLLGVLRLQQGRHRESAELIGRAVALQPAFAGAQLNLGNALKALGRLDDALDRFRTALRLDPSLAEAHANLGSALAALDRPADALPHLEAAARLRPEAAPAWNNLGRAFDALQRHDAARDAYRRALTLQPGYAGAHNNLGLSLKADGRAAEALDHFRAALAAEPEFALALFNLGATLDALDRPAEAVAPLEHALRLMPRYAAAHYALGHAYAGVGRLDDARAQYTAARALAPDFALASQDLGAVEYAAGRYDDALRAFDAALAQRPELAVAQYNRALVRLLRGDYAGGLPDYEARWRVWRAAEPSGDVPCWLGAGRPGGALAGRTLLLEAEQGFGDTLQFVRYVPQVAALARQATPAGRVLLEVQPPLAPLLAPAAQAWGVELLARGIGARPAFDCRCPLASLPLAFDTRLETIPADVPYLTVPAAYRERWRDLFKRGEDGEDGSASSAEPAARRRIGIAWSGAVRARGENRALPLAALAPLFALPDVAWHALQPDLQPADRAALPCCGALRWHGERLADFADTAALIECLDAVVTVDTAVSHLAGALGKPTALLLPFAPDWRWGEAGTRCAWYPSAHLLRQPHPHDWASVIRRCAEWIEALPPRAGGAGNRCTEPPSPAVS